MSGGASFSEQKEPAEKKKAPREWDDEEEEEDKDVVVVEVAHKCTHRPLFRRSALHLSTQHRATIHTR